MTRPCSNREVDVDFISLSRMGASMMVRYGALLVLTVLLRVTGTLMLLGGLVAVILGFAEVMRHELDFADQAIMLGWFEFALGVVSTITGFGMLVYGQVLLLMITVADNTRPIKELAETIKRIAREGSPALTS
jgi:hypothetical protein